jgi:hypothetical protein
VRKRAVPSMNLKDLKTLADVSVWLAHHVEWRDERSGDMGARSVTIIDDTIADDGRCGHVLYEDDPVAHVVRTKRCVRERGHELEALRVARKVIAIAREVEFDGVDMAEALKEYDLANAASGHVS